MTLVPSYLAYRRNKVVSRQLEDAVTDFRSRSRMLHAQITAEMKVTRRWLQTVSCHSGYAFSTDPATTSTTSTTTTTTNQQATDPYRAAVQVQLPPPGGKSRKHAWGPAQQIKGHIQGHVQGHIQGHVQGEQRKGAGGDQVDGGVTKAGDTTQEVTMVTDRSPNYIRRLRLQRSKSDAGVYPVVVPAVLPVYLVQARRDKESKQKHQKQKHKHRSDLLMRSRTDGAIKLTHNVDLAQRRPRTQRSIMADIGKDTVKAPVSANKLVPAGKALVPNGKPLVPNEKPQVPAVTEGSPGTIKLTIRAKVPSHHLPACAGNQPPTAPGMQPGTRTTKHPPTYPPIQPNPLPPYNRPPTCPLPSHPPSSGQTSPHQKRPPTCPAIHPAHLPSEPPPHHPRRSLSHPAGCMRVEEADTDCVQDVRPRRKESYIQIPICEEVDDCCKNTESKGQNGRSAMRDATPELKTISGDLPNLTASTDTPKVTITIRPNKKSRSPTTPIASQITDYNKSSCPVSQTRDMESKVAGSKNVSWELNQDKGKLTKAIMVPLQLQDHPNLTDNRDKAATVGAAAGLHTPASTSAVAGARAGVGALEVRGAPVHQVAEWSNPFPVKLPHKEGMVDPIEEVIEANKEPITKAATGKNTKNEVQGFGSNRRYSIFLNAWHNLPTSQEMSNRMIGRTPARPHFVLQKKFRRAVNASIISQRFKGTNTQPDVPPGMTPEEEERMAEFRKSAGVVKYIRAVSAGSPVRYGQDEEIKMSVSRLKRARKSLTVDRLKEQEKPPPPPPTTQDKELETRIKLFLTKS